MPPVPPDAAARPAPAADKTLLELTAAEGFTRLHAAIHAAGFAGKLHSAGPFTLFAPTDAAFAKLSVEELKQLMHPANRAQLADTLDHHILGGRVLGAEIGNGRHERILGGRVTQLSAYGEPGTWVDLLGVNGVLHPIDRVVLLN